LTFIQVEFIWFYLAVFSAYWLVRNRVAQNALLIVASGVFYGWVHPFWLVLLYISAIVDYLAGISMERWPARKNLVLFVSLATNVGILSYYKYADFFLENLDAALTAAGMPDAVGPIGVLLPAGISFYTFQSMAYSIDIWRGELKARRNILEYLLAVSFFCHLVAGPVQRASNLLQQAEHERRFSWAMVRSGFGLAMWGAFKKIVCADTVSPYVDKILALPDPSAGMVWAAVLGFTVQILADFSGYSDIARGTARMLGWDLMLNFNHPYLATSPSEFWRRWHISFSTWIRDYLYFSFGGSRGGVGRTVGATYAAMLISGLWHGASWNFVLWGAYHATLTVAYRFLTPLVPKGFRESQLGHVLAVAWMFVLTVFGWLLFRVTDVSRITALLRLDPFGGTPAQAAAAVTMLAIAALAAAPLLAALAWETWVAPRIAESPWRLPIQTTAWAAFACTFFVFQRMAGNDFIYFQF
jgi:D-alanyl-lipoteichoic acid acyltransferase DltB (MBOAT superfamily)